MNARAALAATWAVVILLMTSIVWFAADTASTPAINHAAIRQVNGDDYDFVALQSAGRAARVARTVTWPIGLSVVLATTCFITKKGKNQK